MIDLARLTKLHEEATSAHNKLDATGIRCPACNAERDLRAEVRNALPELLALCEIAEAHFALKEAASENSRAFAASNMIEDREERRDARYKASDAYEIVSDRMKAAESALAAIRSKGVSP